MHRTHKDNTQAKDHIKTHTISSRKKEINIFNEMTILRLYSSTIYNRKREHFIPKRRVLYAYSLNDQSFGPINHTRVTGNGA